MEIISHRGYWIDPNEKNKEVSFKRSFNKNFGTETDIRDYNGELVISHDIANKESISVKNFFEIYSQSKSGNLTLALNIKSDGLQDEIARCLDRYSINNYFFFDMSIPDTIGYIKKGLNIFIRQSEYETSLPFYTKIQGVWLDCFEGVWYTEEIIKTHISSGKKVAIVSSELHKRDYIKHWKLLKSWGIIKNDNLILCTDFPEEAIKFFKDE